MSVSGIQTVRERLEALKRLRRQMGWSEEACAHQLGVSYSTLSRWERQETAPRSRAVLEAIDRFLFAHRREMTTWQKDGMGI
ncbi:MAG TPA: helix-turn-helix transcriptional regulator [bacterium]